ncbi:cytochrome c biogenesis CcdA family protein [Microbacterium sp. ZW T5_45]|uniref:cytochrome c biogenesis CcdA family protein n=1 Tax=Microbacterium sp. ZW T5_45 TaxID=3378080 RepID=UPI00385456B0
MEIGFVTAFLGGMLALLSPCSALLLPAFFASTVGVRLRLLAHGAVFYLGLLVTLVPFGLGIGALGSLIMSERGLIIAVTSVVLVTLGVAQIFGFGFDLSRLFPGASALQQKAATGTGLVRTFLLGAVGGVAGFCAGPILGTILTIALAQGDLWSAGVLLAVYGAGMVVPLVVIAAVWQRLGARGRGMLRGRTFHVHGREFHTTSVITGLLIAGVGVLFWFTNGLVSLPSPVPTDLLSWLQVRGELLADPVFDIIAILALTVLALVGWALARRRSRAHRADPQPAAEARS